jgi:hemerythrin-like domain-containing protein
MAARKGKSAPSRKKKSADAITLLKEDHEKVRGLLKQLESAKAPRRREELLAKIDEEVRIHSTIEEEIFYPAFREAAEKKEDRELFFEALEEHHVVDLVMPEAKETEPGAEEFAAKAKVLKELIEHHADEEEKEMFPKAKKLMDREELLDLGERIRQRKSELGGS